MQDDPLTERERQRLAELPRELPIPPGLEDRVVAGLASRGLLRRRWSWPARAAAACILLLVGFVAGRAPWGPAPDIPTDSTEQRYLLLLYGGRAESPAEDAERVTEYSAWARELAHTGRLVSAEQLEAASLVLGGDASAPRDPSDPAGFFIIRAATWEEAAAVAGQCPHLRHAGTVVLRAIQPPHGTAERQPGTR